MPPPFWLLLGSAVIIASSARADAPPACPAALPAQTLSATALEPGWQLQQELPLPLSGVGFMAGAPASLAHLRPDHESRVGAESRAQWKLAGEHWPQGKWLACFYGQSRIVMARRLSDATQACSLRSRAPRRAGEPLRVVALQCREAP